MSICYEACLSNQKCLTLLWDYWRCWRKLSEAGRHRNYRSFPEALMGQAVKNVFRLILEKVTDCIECALREMYMYTPDVYCWNILEVEREEVELWFFPFSTIILSSGKEAVTPKSVSPSPFFFGWGSPSSPAQVSKPFSYNWVILYTRGILALACLLFSYSALHWKD